MRDIAKTDTVDDVELWFVDLSACAGALDDAERATPRLAVAEIKKITASITPASAAERRAAYIALRILCERFWGPSWRGVPYTLTGSGKPALIGLGGAQAAPGGSFSLAHVDRYALIGVTRAGAIGVDLEPDRQPTVSDERRQRIESAAIALARGAMLPEARQRRFLQAWVRLEALAKADGRGIGRLLTGLGIIGPHTPGEPGFTVSYAHDVLARFFVDDVPLDQGDCVAAVALDRSIAGLRVNLLPSTTQGLEQLLR